MNKILIALFLTTCIATYSSDINTKKTAFQYKVITEPYTPSFIQRHTLLTKAAGLFCAGALVYIGAQCSHTNTDPFPTPLLLMGTGAALATATIVHTSQHHLLDLLLTNPLQALNKIYAVERKFKEGILADHPNMESYDLIQQTGLFKQYIEKYTRRYPILFLGECTAYGCEACVFSRAYNQKYRASFETVVSSECLKKIGTANNPLIYTSFGCGGAFQDLVILTKVLTQMPTAQVTVHLLDGQHILYTTAKTLLAQRRVINTKIRTDLTTVLSDLAQIARAEDSSTNTISDSTLQKKLADKFAYVEEKYAQMLSFLEKSFPNASINIHIHDVVESYWEYCQQNRLAAPDVLHTCDIQDEMSLLRNGPRDYINLCALTLNQKPTSYNAWLAKKEINHTSEVSICTVSLASKQINDQEIDIEIDNRTISTYVHEEYKI